MNTEQKLKKYLSMLIEAQKTTNLISNNSILNAWERHFVDSMQLIDLIDIDNTQNLLDIGSGAGFPGLVIATTEPKINVHIVESTKKKCNFMQSVADELELTNTKIYHSRIEDISCIDSKNKKSEIYLPTMDIITARAVASLDTLINYSRPFMNYKTICLFPKGSSAEQEITKKYKRFKIKLLNSKTDSNSKIIKLSKNK